jgi:4'-phosphopantetheinyl transferase
MTTPSPWAMPCGHDVPLPIDRVDCWAVALDDAPADQDGAVTALLSTDERARAERFRFDRHRRMYVNTHAALRLLLARYLQASPASLAIVPDRHGRPVLAACAGRLHFNLSHSGAVALVGVSCLAPVGVDVEELRDMPDFAQIARRYFAPGEVENVLQLVPAERLGGFFVTWTRKEAYVKALGLGLSFPLDTFSTGRPDGPAHVLHSGGVIYQGWTLTDLACGGGYRAALAVGHPNASIVCRQAPWPWLLEGIHSSALNSANAASTVAGS